MQERGWLKKISDACSGITKGDYQACERLATITGLKWEPYHVWPTDFTDSHNRYACYLPNRKKVTALQAVMHRYLTDSAFGSFVQSGQNEQGHCYSIGERYETYLSISQYQVERFAVLPHYSKDAFAEDLRQEFAKIEEQETALGTKFQTLKL